MSIRNIKERIFLLTGRIISRHKVIPIPITQEFIDIVESQDKKDGTKFPLKYKYS